MTFKKTAFAFVAVALSLLAGSCGSTPSPVTSIPEKFPPTPASANVRWDLPNLPFWRVDYWVDRFASGDKRQEFETYLARLPQYDSMIREKLRSRGMPEDLIYLAMIEAGFNPDAHSTAGAAGMWQLVPDTARRYGLKVDDTVDERHDPEKSTDAALAYLADLHERFGSWYLAAAAYNTGENRVGRIMTEVTGSEKGTDEDYYRIWDQLPGQTRDFVPVMIAAGRIVKEPERYGFRLPS